MVSLHAHNEAGRIGLVLGWLDEGEDVALVSDAGTPLVSDPGSRLVAAVAEAGHPVVPIPGPSALLAAVVGSGLPSDRFVFLGFVPRKGQDRVSTLERISGSSETCVVFESPERLVAFLEALQDRLEPMRRLAVARELTKLHEEFRRGTAGELAAHYRAHPPRGEVSVVIEAGAVDETVDGEVVRARARSLLDGGVPASQVSRELARSLGVPRNRAYDIVQELKGEAE
jgi:16S rRNA (cytidine1402-2'-O)-methyltransferase